MRAKYCQDEHNSGKDFEVRIIRIIFSFLIFFVFLGISEESYAQVVLTVDTSVNDFYAKDNARPLNGQVKNDVFNYGVSTDIALHLYVYMVGLGVDFGFGGLWMDRWKSDAKKRDSDFSGNFFFDFAFLFPKLFGLSEEADTLENYYPYTTFKFGLGTIYTVKRKNTPEYNLVQPDGADGTPAAFALKFALSKLFPVAKVGDVKFCMGPNFQYILGIKSMDDNNYHKKTLYHYIMAGLSITFGWGSFF